MKNRIKTFLFDQVVFWLIRPRLFTRNKPFVDRSQMRFTYFDKDYPEQGFTLSILGALNGALIRIFDRMVWVFVTPTNFKSIHIGKEFGSCRKTYETESEKDL